MFSWSPTFYNCKEVLRRTGKVFHLKNKKHVLQISLEMAKDNDGEVRVSLGQI